MSKAKAKLTYSGGFLRGRVTAPDDTTGVQQVAAGLMYRVRCSHINVYHAGEEGVVVLFLMGEDDPIFMVGSIEELDSVMDRAGLREVK